MINFGVFEYSEEEGTAAALMKEKVPKKEMTKRRNKIMNIQQEISKQNLEKNIGKTFETIVEGISKNKKYYIGRTYMDVPEEDGILYIKADKEIKERFVECKILEIKNYDMIGEVYYARKE